ncbi:MAG: LEA type 2 family protein [Thermomonas sp.]
MSLRIRLAAGAAVLLLLAACASGPVRRVSEPAVGIQQLTVGADGNWAIEVRINNFSSIPMRFDAVDLKLSVAGQDAGSLSAQPALDIGPESANVVNVSLKPQAMARLQVANALASGQGIAYSLSGNVRATPEKSKQRSFDVKRDSSLSPVPGVPGALR